MYTRHVNIPKNYSGVRFQRHGDDNMSVKEHRPFYSEGVKSSHSPLYNQKIAAPVDEIEEKDLIDDLTEESEINVTSTEESDAGGDLFDAEVENAKEVITEEKAKPSSISNLFSDLPITNILGNINREDLLLLGLIFLMATEKNGGNNDILTMLSLLLLKHK